MKTKMILCVGLTPAVQELREFRQLRLGEVNRAVAVERSAAGKAVNVARVLRQLGGRPLLLGFAGGDTGKFLRQCLRQEGIAARWTRVAAPTRVCTTLRELGSGRVTELVEEAACPGASEWAAFFQEYRRCAGAAQFVVIAGALMPGAPVDVYARLAAVGRGRVIIDSQREALWRVLPQRPLVAKLNAEELANTVGRGDLVAGARKLLRAGAQSVVVTRGADGAWLVTGDGVWQARPPRVRAVNPIGSGDAVTAGIARALAQGGGLPEALRWGVACGAANVLTRAAGSVDVAEVRRLLRRVTLI